MGAIAACLSPSPPADPSRVERMLRAAPHRGQRYQVLARGRCAVGVSRPEDGADASIAADDGWIAALTGRIDDLDRLVAVRRDACGDGAAAAALLAAFRERGIALADRLRGAFAAMISDGSSLWCFRDHVGFAPLFYRRDGNGLHVATEAKQVIAGSGIRAEPDLDVLERIFYESFDDDTPCALRGVRRLPKATVLAAEDGGVRLERYWRPEALLETARLSATDLRDRFEELMRQAARRSLTGSDVVALSGGVDSPAVAAFAAPEHLRRTGRALAAISLLFPAFPAVDERRYVELVADRLGLTLHTYEPAARPLDDLAEWVRIADGPVPATSLAEAHELYARAHALGFRTILTGELAEYVIDTDRDLLAHLLLRGRLGAAFDHLRAERAAGLGLTR
ncbi:MAG: asparagine synthase-related protein, partial [Candidatus Limnocylindria bacterium]